LSIAELVKRFLVHRFDSLSQVVVSFLFLCRGSES
jgi:hypothetical protein